MNGKRSQDGVEKRDSKTEDYVVEMHRRGGDQRYKTENRGSQIL